MNKATELVVGAGVGAVASEILKVVITEAKLVLAFKSVSKDLASTMEELVPIVREIEQTQGVEEVEELKTLKDTIDKARVVVIRFSYLDLENSVNFFINLK
uniref:RPW8 domain-containing protein n=1 Tax=Brassica campestris TaxID=3711 RepID=M4D6K6_BRACM